MKRAIIIKGNSKFIDNRHADIFYEDLKSFFEKLGYKASFDSGEPHTTPPKADLWVGHSRGNERLRFAPEGTCTISIGAAGGINHPKDNAIAKGQEPDQFHFILTKEMKTKIIEELNINQTILQS